MSVADSVDRLAKNTSRSLAFTLTSDRITADEQAVFQADLDSMGLDECVWDVLNSTLQTGTDASTPMVARAYSGDRLAGAALVYECRKSGDCFFDPPISRLMDLPGLPMFFWLRYGTTVDHCANPGFVAEGVDRRDFVEQAVRFLLKRYLLGTVVEYATAPALPGARSAPFVDTGVIDTSQMSDVSDYLSIGKNLSRKLKKFRNKGGEVRVFEGAIPPELQRSALDAFETLDVLVRTPFQDNYLNMVKANTSIDGSGMVHFVALLDGQYAGHQSFCRSGQALHCQAGAFDRRMKSTYHAYENIIVSSVEYALNHGLQRIDYGPVLNETKMKMMTRFIPIEMRTYARYRPVAAGIPYLFRLSKLAPQRLQSWSGLGESAATAFV